MMLVTGCAGFIGSHLVERLLKLGNEVIGIDSFSDYYPRKMKERNMEGFIDNEKFRLVEGDINEIELSEMLKGVDMVFHQAAQPGVLASWGKSFDVYVKNNVLATQKLLEACKGGGIKKFVYASSSSVYGDAESLPTMENVTPRPVSPYGVSKLAGEHLCYLYNKNFKIPTVSLRYFSVYGPRQRPDMAFHKLIKCVLKGEEFGVYGDGTQTRDFTYISDVVDANILAMNSGVSTGVFNIGGGSRISVNDCIKVIEDVSGKKAIIKYNQVKKGDVTHTSADISSAGKRLGYSPKIGLKNGIKTEMKWFKSVY